MRLKVAERINKKSLIDFLSWVSLLSLGSLLIFNPFLTILSIAQVQKSSSSDVNAKEKALKQLIKANRAVLRAFANDYLKLRKQPLSAKLTHLKQMALPLEKAAENLDTFLKVNSITNSNEARDQLDTLNTYAEFASKNLNDRSVFLTDEVTTRARILRRDLPPFESGANGKIVLLSVFGSDGAVKYTIVAQSLGKDIDEQAIKTARRIRFIPASKDGYPVSQLVEIEYQYASY